MPKASEHWSPKVASHFSNSRVESRTNAKHSERMKRDQTLRSNDRSNHQSNYRSIDGGAVTADSVIEPRASRSACFAAKAGNSFWYHWFHATASQPNGGAG
jgi:hypothetical protein